MKTMMKKANGFIETAVEVETAKGVEYMYKKLRVKSTEETVEEIKEEVKEMTTEALNEVVVVVVEQTGEENNTYSYEGESVEDILARIDAKVKTHEDMKRILEMSHKARKKYRPKNNVQKLLHAVGVEPMDVYKGLCKVEKRINKIFK